MKEDVLLTKIAVSFIFKVDLRRWPIAKFGENLKEDLRFENLVS